MSKVSDETLRGLVLKHFTPTRHRLTYESAEDSTPRISADMLEFCNEFEAALEAVSSIHEAEPVGANGELDAGINYAIERLCEILDIDPKSISWDAATETMDGDVSSVICNVLIAAYGEEWSSKPEDTATIKAALGTREPYAAQQVFPSALLEALAEAVVQDVCEWDDRTSPEGYEGYMFLTPVEFREQLERFAISLYAHPAPISKGVTEPKWQAIQISDDPAERLAYDLAVELEQADLDRNDFVTVNRAKLLAISKRCLDRLSHNAGETESGGEVERLTKERDIALRIAADLRRKHPLSFKFDMIDAAEARAEAAEKRLADLAEQAFRAGVAYATNCEVTDVDLAWSQSRVRAALKEQLL